MPTTLPTKGSRISLHLGAESQHVHGVYMVYPAICIVKDFVWTSKPPSAWLADQCLLFCFGNARSSQEGHQFVALLNAFVWSRTMLSNKASQCLRRVCGFVVSLSNCLCLVLERQRAGFGVLFIAWGRKLGKREVSHFPGGMLCDQYNSPGRLACVWIEMLDDQGTRKLCFRIF